MTWLLLSILCSTLIFVVFKLFRRFAVDNLSAIVVNYLVAYAAGSFLSQADYHWPAEIFTRLWWPSVLLLGLLFITLFQLMAWVSQTLGVAAVSVAVKMSVIVPVGFSIWYFSESMDLIKTLGLILALAAVFLATYKPQRVRSEWRLLLGPLLLFLGSGFLDAFINYNEEELVSSAELSFFATAIFGTAGLIGLIWLAAVKGGYRKLTHGRNILGGLALGLPNYGSIYFLLQALNQPELPSSNLFAFNNVGIVALSTLIGSFVFKEHLSLFNKWGLGLAMVSMFLIFYTL